MSAYPFAVPLGYPVASSGAASLLEAVGRLWLRKANDSLPNPGGSTVTARLSLAVIEARAEQLGRRDRAILLDLARVRVLTGAQATRLHFSDLSPQTRERIRRRVFSRLISLGFIEPLERRIGGVRAGSSGLIYSLSAGGQRVLPFIMASFGMNPPNRPRKPWTPGLAFLSHTLDISELYVQLVEVHRSGQLALTQYLTEAAAWFSGAIGGTLKPDAYLAIQSQTARDYWAVEVDRATESLPTLRRKLMAYVDFAHMGQQGHDGVMPRVLVTVPHTRRLEAVQGLIQGLPAPAGQLFLVVPFEGAVLALIGVLKE